MRAYVRTCVRPSVCPVHCGKTADRIRMPFGIIDRTGLVWGSVHGKGYFWGEFGARHCNQWRLYGVRVRQRRDAALFPSYFGQTCLNSTDCQSINRFISDRKPTNQYKKLWYRRDSMRCVKRPLNVTQGRPLLCQSTRHMISY